MGEAFGWMVHTLCHETSHGFICPLSPSREGPHVHHGLRGMRPKAELWSDLVAP